MGAALSSLRDNFTDNSISTSAWVEGEVGSATAAETSGQIRFTLPSSTAGSHIARLTSRSTYDLTSDSFYINIDTMVATGVAATAFFQLYLNGGNTFQWIQLSGTLQAYSVIAGVQVSRYSAAWSASTYKYLRIRADTTTIYWDSSSNGTSWTNRASLAIPFPITDLFVDFGATCGNVASPGSFRLEDVNLVLPALSTTWRWTQMRRALVNRNRVTTLAIDTANTVQGYLITADGVDVSGNPSGNVRYWSGPAGGGRLLTEQPDEASAQAMAVNLPLDGRFDLAEMVDLRVVRLGHRSADGNSYVLREAFNRRLVQADDIEAESIRAFHIRAGEITADLLAAMMVISNTISTAYNGARVTLSGGTFGGLIGYGDADTYSPATGVGTYQILWDKADGKLYAGTGNVILDESGISIELTSSVFADRAYRFINSSGVLQATLSGSTSSAQNTITLANESLAGKDGTIQMTARAPAGKQAAVSMNANNGSAGADLTCWVSSAGVPTIDIGDNTVTVNIAAGLNLGTATGAPDGTVRASGVFQPGDTAVSYNAELNASLANTGVMALGLTVETAVGFALIWAGGAGAMFIFNGATHTTVEVSDPSGVYSATAGTASSINVYWSAGNSRYEIQNNRGSAIAVRVWILEA